MVFFCRLTTLLSGEMDSGGVVPERRRHAASAEVLQAILDAAAMEFAAHGFDGASTRRIADRAGVFQAQVGYHAGTKSELWKATVDRLFDQLRDSLDIGGSSDADLPVADPVEAFAGLVHAHVAHTARHPELQRIMSQEATGDSERVTYLLDRHVRPVFSVLELVWDEVRASGRAADVDAAWVFMVMIGIGPLPFAQRPFLQPLLGDDAVDPVAHATRLLDLLLR
jgi:TetR/AcrR family transcriptional regulator